MIGTKSKKVNKHRKRTTQFENAVKTQILNDYVVNSIEQYNFEKLVRSGVIVREPVNDSSG